MPAFVRPLLLIACLLAGCGNQIGDACIVATDCSSDGTRECDTSQFQGYCTILGCDYDTCPGEAECVRFFSGEFSNKPCTQNMTTAPSMCSEDELCALDGFCVPRASEQRYCMLKCSSDGDCRDHYECRDLTKMIDHGGEPVLAPGLTVDDTTPRFCAPSP
jgi:hypothetical protein